MELTQEGYSLNSQFKSCSLSDFVDTTKDKVVDVIMSVKGKEYKLTMQEFERYMKAKNKNNIN